MADDIRRVQAAYRTQLDAELAAWRVRDARQQAPPRAVRVRTPATVAAPRERRDNGGRRRSSSGQDPGGDDPPPEPPLERLARRPLQPRRDLLRHLAERARAFESLDREHVQLELREVA